MYRCADGKTYVPGQRPSLFSFMDNRMFFHWYRDAPKTAAVIGFYGDLPDMAPDKVMMAGGKFAIVLQPDEQLLRDMEFDF